MRKLVNAVLVVILLGLLLLGFRELQMYQKDDASNTALRDSVVKVSKDRPEDPFYRYIDFKALQSINPDIKGWIYVPGTSIDYPILIGNSDTKYLNRNYKGYYSSIGAIFGYSGVDVTFDSHVCLFGHNMVSGKMFSELRRYKDAGYANERMKAYIYTPERTKELSLVSVFSCRNKDEVFEVSDKKADSSDVTLLNKLGDRSIHKYPEIHGFSGQIYSLVTCDGYNGTSKRMTVHYAVTKEKYNIE